MADSGVSLVAGKTQNWGFDETKTLVGLWAGEDIQRQLASMGCSNKTSRKRLQSKRRPVQDQDAQLTAEIQEG